MSLGCACIDDADYGIAPAPPGTPAVAQSAPPGGRRVRSFVLFVLRSFYVLAIRRCKPGPARWP